MRAILIVLDSVGIGYQPDAGNYGDTGANTLAHTAEAVNGLNIPALQRMGLGNIPALIPNGAPIKGVPPTDNPTASYGAMMEVSQGKDTTTGHWEIAGIKLDKGFHVFPPGPPAFPSELVRQFEERTGRKLIGNKAASGTDIIDELGAEQLKTGAFIAYTSADSVFQIAAHEDIIPLGELYAACETARTLCNDYMVGRVIARPFTGAPGKFKRTEQRKDYSYPLPAPTILDRLTENGHNVYLVGKLEDIFNRRGMTESFHTGNNADSQRKIEELLANRKSGLIFANFIDFDMLWGHRRNPEGYASALEQTDKFLDGLLKQLEQDDLLIITADHGNDPTFQGTDHTREFVPLLAYSKNRGAKNTGLRNGFYDIAQSLASFFNIDKMPLGTSFL